MKRRIPLGIISLCMVPIGIIVMWSLLTQKSHDDAAKADYMIMQSISPDGLHTISVIGHGEPTWSFGPQQISLQFDDNQNLITTTIANDGREADVRNVTWNQNTVSLEISGRNSPCQQYMITFNSDNVTVSISK